VTRTSARFGVLALAIVMAGAACSSSKKTTSSTASASTPATTAAAAPSTSAPSASTPAPSGGASSLRSQLATLGPAEPSAFTVSLAKGPQGIFVVGPNGHTLYIRSTDKGTTSSCTATCASNWPALTATGTLTGGPAVDTTKLGTATGQVANQVTYYGHLLYYFVGDTAPEQTNGVGKPDWFLLGPVGNQMAPAG
jgi:predicted lipoprotein with Yx(FWY)xxD motif